ncbi:glycosyltransferase family 4 protein [Pontibacter sp. 172403-2]|uniref:glycosyltransferase n=1 Tax=Pontibacter rufus TaxID=2791028 RepID=UPI0018AFDD17|nr:glycosyltransferase [Pontibacter sp. 172403-2]MBF9254968.1 glycosyltransferase family 4 protein [Pontibacter sp. 172403-2]
MRIAYLVEVDITEETGVTKKIKGQTNSWAQEGHDVKIFSFPSVLSSEVRNRKNIIDVSSETFLNPIASFFSGQVQNYLNKILSSQAIARSLQDFSPDIIYYRQGIWFPGIHRIFSQKAPIILEANTNDLEEIKLEGKVRRIIYTYGRKKILKHVLGVVSVTNEIGEYYQGLVPYIKTVSNGFVFNDEIPAHTLTASFSNKPSLIFVGMPGYSWHGVDKILRLASLLPEFTFHLVGYEKANLPEMTDNIICHGYLRKDSLKTLYATADIGIGTLALHRKNMDEACPLKVREYCAFGLPVILGYKDTDLEGQDFILDIGNFEENVVQSIDSIKNFVRAWHGKKTERSVVEPLIGLNAKEKERLAFFKSVQNASENQAK